MVRHFRVCVNARPDEERLVAFLVRVACRSCARLTGRKIGTWGRRSGGGDVKYILERT